MTATGRAKPKHSLTERQQQVATLVGQGLSNKEIAEQLGISEGTVKQHIFAIFRELNLSSRAKLAVVGQKMGMRYRASTPKNAALDRSLSASFSWRLIAAVVITFAIPPEVKPTLLMKRNQLLIEYRELLAELVEALDGKSMALPDGGTLVWFGHPISHIDDATRATSFAQTLFILLQAKALANNLRFGIGVATHAEAVPSLSEQLITTKAFQTAATLAQKALRAGFILANPLTQRLTPASLSWLELKPKTPAGLNGAQADDVKKQHLFVLQSTLRESAPQELSYWGPLAFLDEIFLTVDGGLAHWLAVETWPPSMASSLMDAIGAKAQRAGFLSLRLHLTSAKQAEQMVRSLLTQIEFYTNTQSARLDEIDLVLQLIAVISELAQQRAVCLQIAGLQTLAALRDALGPRGVDRLLSQRLLFVTTNVSSLKNPQTSIRVLGPRPSDAVFNRVHILDEPTLDLMPDGVMVDIQAVYDDLSPAARHLALMAAQDGGVTVDGIFTNVKMPRPLIQNALQELTQSGLLFLKPDGAMQFRDAYTAKAISQLNQLVD